MNDLQLHSGLASDGRVITLYEICKVLDKRHRDAKKLADEIQVQDGFGTVRNIRVVYNDKGQTTETYSYTKKQALIIGARLDSRNIIKLVNSGIMSKASIRNHIDKYSLINGFYILSETTVKTYHVSVWEEAYGFSVE